MVKKLKKKTNENQSFTEQYFTLLCGCMWVIFWLCLLHFKKDVCYEFLLMGHNLLFEKKHHLEIKEWGLLQDGEIE